MPWPRSSPRMQPFAPQSSPRLQPPAAPAAVAALSPGQSQAAAEFPVLIPPEQRLCGNQHRSGLLISSGRRDSTQASSPRLFASRGARASRVSLRRHPLPLGSCAPRRLPGGSLTASGLAGGKVHPGRTRRRQVVLREIPERLLNPKSLRAP